MLNVDLHDMLKGGISRYELVAATAKRARQIVDEVAHSNDNITDVTAKHKLYERSEAECGEILDKGLKDAVPKAENDRRDKKSRRNDKRDRRSAGRSDRREGRRFDGREAKPEVKPATTRVRKAPKVEAAPAPEVQAEATQETEA